VSQVSRKRLVPPHRAVRMSADIAGHGDDGKDRDPSAESLLTEQSDGFANAMNFAPLVEQRGVSANGGAYR